MPPKRYTILDIDVVSEVVSKEELVIAKETLNLELGSIAILCGNSEVGKSFLALKICANCIKEKHKPFFWSIEDNRKSIFERVNNVNSFYPFDTSKIEFSTELPVRQKTPATNLFDELDSLRDCNVIILDTFSAFFSQFGFADQNNQNDVQMFFNVLSEIARKNNQAILLIHHLDKKGESLLGSSVIGNAARLVYQLSLPANTNKNTTNYRVASVLKDSSYINKGEHSKIIQVLNNPNVAEVISQDMLLEEKYKFLEPLYKKEIIYFYEFAGQVTMHENRGLFYLSSNKIEDSRFYEEFKKNDNQYSIALQNPNGSRYMINLKNKLLNQTHRSILDALFLYVRHNVSFNKIRYHQNKNWDITVHIRPYEFLKNYMNKTPQNYEWLKSNLEDIGRFSYDLSYYQNINGKEDIVTMRDKEILTFDSVERITRSTGKISAVFILTIRSEYIQRLCSESSFVYDAETIKILVNLRSQAVQDLVRFLISFPDKKILTFKEFCNIKAYKSYKAPIVISRQKKEFIKAKDKLIHFGINVYGKNVPLAEYDDRGLAERYKDEDDLIFIYESNNKIKRLVKKDDIMNRLNIQDNQLLNFQ